MEPAGHEIPDYSPGKFHCGTYGPGYLRDKHPDEVGVEVEMTACFDGIQGGDCIYKSVITVTKCTDFYVYHLVKPPGHNLRYCATIP